MSLTVGGSGVAVYPPGATFGPRRLEDFEFVWLLQGSAEWRYDQGGIALGPSSLLLGRPGMTESFLWDRSRPTRHGYLPFRLDGRPATLPDPARWPLVRALPDDDPLRPLLRYLHNVVQDRSGDHQGYVQEMLGLLLTLFVQGPLPGPTSSSCRPTSTGWSPLSAVPGRHRHPPGPCPCRNWPRERASRPAT